MKTSDFDYELPEELIAQTPVSPRDHSRLLVYDRQTKETFDRHFYDVTDYLKKGDVLVVNETKVIPARLYGKKRGTETDFEFLLLKRLQLDIWEVIMRPGKKLKPGGFVDFGDDLCAELLCKKEDGVCEVGFITTAFLRSFWTGTEICRCHPISQKNWRKRNGTRRFTQKRTAAPQRQRPACILRLS